MNGIDVIVIAAGAATIGLLAWFFFGPKRSTAAALHQGVQQVTVTVKGGYSPDVIRVTAGTPLRLTFDRQETGDCTSRVVFPDFQLSQSLPATMKASTTTPSTTRSAWSTRCAG